MIETFLCKIYIKKHLANALGQGCRPTHFHVSKHLKTNTILFVIYSQDCPTNWGTKQKMIERILEQAPAIRRVLDDRRSQYLIPTWQDIAVLESVTTALKKVANFTDALSSENTVTASSVKVVLQLLTKDLLLPAKEDTELTHNLKRKMTTALEDKYSALATHQLLAEASLLDPRYRDGNPEGNLMQTFCKKNESDLLSNRKEQTSREFTRAVSSQGICRRKPSIPTRIRLHSGKTIRLDSYFWQRLPEIIWQYVPQALPPSAYSVWLGILLPR